MYYFFFLSSCLSSSYRPLASSFTLKEILNDYKNEPFYRLYYDLNEFKNFENIFTDTERKILHEFTFSEWNEQHFNLFLKPLVEQNFSYLGKIDLYYFFIINLEKNILSFKDDLLKIKTKKDFFQLLLTYKKYYEQEYDENELNIFYNISDSNYQNLIKKKYFQENFSNSQKESIDFLNQVYRSLSYVNILSLIEAYKEQGTVSLEASFGKVLKLRYKISF